MITDGSVDTAHCFGHLRRAEADAVKQCGGALPRCGDPHATELAEVGQQLFAAEVVVERLAVDEVAQQAERLVELGGVLDEVAVSGTALPRVLLEPQPFGAAAEALEQTLAPLRARLLAASTTAGR